jgi:hypothetical protein
MPNDLSAALLTFTIVVGSFWLAADYARQRAHWFAWLFALLAVERLAALTPVPPVHLLAGFPVAVYGVRLAITVILVRLVVGRLLYLLARRRNLLETPGEHSA